MQQVVCAREQLLADRRINGATHNVVPCHAVDGSEIRQTHQLRLVVYPIIYRVLAPSQVVVWDF